MLLYRSSWQIAFGFSTKSGKCSIPLFSFLTERMERNFFPTTDRNVGGMLFSLLRLHYHLSMPPFHTDAISVSCVPEVGAGNVYEVPQLYDILKEMVCFLHKTGFGTFSPAETRNENQKSSCCSEGTCGTLWLLVSSSTDEPSQ